MPDRCLCSKSRLAARCTHSGAEITSKKTLISAQNLENKGSEIFLPRRSMVLKVVRGKILETWELGAPIPVLNRSQTARLSKINDYLTDNQTLIHYHESTVEINRKAAQPAGAVQIWELRSVWGENGWVCIVASHPFRSGRGKSGADAFYRGARATSPRSPHFLTLKSLRSNGYAC